MKCPGQDMQYWKPGDIFETQCPKCGSVVEFFKDDPTRRCAACGHRFANPKMDFGCAAYCPYAEQCLGDLPPELVAQQENLFKDRVALEMKRLFGRDFRRIGRATRAARYAEQLARAEGGNLAVILSAVYLREVGRPEDPSGRQAPPDPSAAVDVLARLKASEGIVEGVRAILGRTDPVDAGSPLEDRIVSDAVRLGEMEARLGKGSEASGSAAAGIDELLTPTGREAALRLTDAGSPASGERQPPR